MTILFMYDSPLLPEKGGTERATKLVMDELARRGHTTIGLLHFNQADPDEYFLNGDRIHSLTDFLDENHVDVVVNQIAFHYWLLKEFLAHGGQEWKEKGGKIISFMHFDPDINYVPIKSYYRNFWQKDLVHKIKRLGFFFFIPKYRRLYKKTRIESFRYIYEQSDRYVVMSPSYIRALQQLTGFDSMPKVCVITNMLTFPDIADRSILGVKEKMVLIVSRLDENQKRISLMIKAWLSLKDHYGYKLHIVGSGQDELFLKQLAVGCKDIVFDGAQSPLVWYQRARIFLLASPREGWGLTLTESLQNGVVPVVMNTSKVFGDIICDGRTGFFADTPQQYAKRIELLMTDDQLRNKMAVAGLESAHRFSPESVGDKWEKMLNEM